MTNTISILIYLPLLIVTGLLFVSVVVKKNKLYVDHLYTLLCALLLGWQVFELLIYIVSSSQAVEFVFSAKFIFIAFIPPVYMLMVSAFYREDRWFSVKTRICLMLIPAVTAILAGTSSFHSLFRRNFSVLSLSPLTKVASEWGVWYAVNLVYSQAIAMSIAFFFIIQYRKLPKAYLTSVNLLLIAWFIYVVGIVAEFFGLDGRLTLDFNLIGVCLSNFICYIAVSSGGRADYWNIWRRDMFDYLDEAIIILDSRRVVAEANFIACNLFEDINPDMVGSTINEILQPAEKAGLVTVKPVYDENRRQIGRDLYITRGEYPVIYNIQRQSLPQTDKSISGEFITLAEVTWNRLLIERLRETAGIDLLTGTGNRFGYELKLREFDLPENLPLSVIIIDANNLKTINDSFGHEAGDDMLRQIAELLREHCPEDSYIARIGGDEFAVLLRHCDRLGADRLADTLHSAAVAVTGLHHMFSFALGGATKVYPQENINTLIRQADESMYADKRAHGGDVSDE